MTTRYGWAIASTGGLLLAWAVWEGWYWLAALALALAAFGLGLALGYVRARDDLTSIVGEVLEAVAQNQQGRKERLFLDNPEDVVGALRSLGFNKREADAAASDSGQGTVAERVRRALQKVGRTQNGPMV